MKTTMKSAMKAAALLLMATVMTAGLASCSSDDDNGKITDTNIAGTVITVTPDLPDDCVNTYENSLIYTDGAGKEHTAKLENGKSIEIKSSTPESTGTLVIHQTIKDGVTLTPGTYMYGAKLKFSIKGVNAKGQTVCVSGEQVGNLLYSTSASQLAETIATDPMKARYTLKKTSDEKNPLYFFVELITAL